MYKVLPVAGGWFVFFIEEGQPPKPDVGRKKPYTHKTHAYRRARRLNQRLAEVEAMMSQDAII